MPLRLRWIILIAIVVTFVVVRPKGPAAVQPALSALERLGYGCSDGEKELGPPNGLYQWRCTRTRDGHASIVGIEGNDRGIAGFTIDVFDTNPALARAAFAEVVTAVPPLASTPSLADALAGWSGPQASQSIDGIGVTAVCDATQCLAYVGLVPTPTQPPAPT